MHQNVVSVSYRLCPACPEGECAAFWCRKNPLFFSDVLLFLQNLQHESTVFFPTPRNRGQNVTRNGGPQIGACLISSESNRILLCKFPLKMPFVGVQETVLLVNRAFVPPKKKGVFDENGENDEFAF